MQLVELHLNRVYIPYVMVKMDESTETPVNKGVSVVFWGSELVRFFWMYQADFGGLPGIEPGKDGFRALLKR